MKITTENITPIWQEHLRENEFTRFFSPYLTSDTAEQVLSKISSNCEIFTVFSAENFITGASSIGCLRSLSEAGCVIYHLPDLHAKIALSEPTFATVGSQNLTNRGQIQKEANVVIDDPEHIVQLAKAIEPWLQQRIEITIDMIKQMEKNVKPLYSKFAKIKKEAEDVDKKIFDEANNKRRIAERKQRFRRTLASLRGYSNPKSGYITHLNTNWGTNANVTLFSHDDLTTWSMTEREVPLIRTYRYLCLNQEDSTLGWVRVVKTRITKIGQGVTRVGVIEHQNCSWSINLESNWNISPENDHNLTVVFSNSSGQEAAKAYCWFSVDDLEVLFYEENGEFKSGQNKSFLIDAISSNAETLRQDIRKLVISPFRYQHNLLGKEASDFFGPIGSHWQLRIVTKDSSPFLVVKRR